MAVQLKSRPITSSPAWRGTTSRIGALRAAVAAWHYTGAKRDLRLDLLRGFAVFAMVVDHVGNTDLSLLLPLTGGNQFCVSAAEAFVFISGLVMGMVYVRVMAKGGTGSGLLKAFKRAGTLYAVTIAVGLAFLGLSVLAKAPWTPAAASGGDPSFLFEYLTLRQTFFLVDIPLMYTLLLLLAVPGLYLLSQGRAWLLLAVSGGVWLAWQLAPGGFALPWAIEGNSVFHLPAWQVLFFLGLACGWHRASLERLVERLPRRLALFGVLSMVASVTLLYIAQITALDSLRSDGQLSAVFFDKADVPAGRLLAFALFGGCAFLLAGLAWRPIQATLGWLLLPLGQNALTAYSLHLFVVLAAWKLSDVVAVEWSPVLVTAYQLAAVLAVWAIIRGEARWKLHRQQRQAVASAEAGLAQADTRQ